MPEAIRLTAEDIRRACDELTRCYAEGKREKVVIDSFDRVKAVLALLSPDGTERQQAYRAAELVKVLGFDVRVYQNCDRTFSLFLTPRSESAHTSAVLTTCSVPIPDIPKATNMVVGQMLPTDPTW